MTEPLSETTDVFVAGGGPAGLAAAIAARMKGFRVTVADPVPPPIDKACGEGLMPDGVAALERLGVTIDPALGAVFRGIRFREPGRSVEAHFPSGRGLGLRRKTLHRILLEHAAKAGVQLCWGVAARGLTGDGVIVNGRKLACRWIVAADGQNSALRGWAGLNSGRSYHRRLGFRRHFRVSRWTDHVEVHWADSCQAYVTPVAADEVCVALISRDPRTRFDDLPRLFPELWRRLAEGEPTSATKGAITATRSFRSVARGRVALIGEASGSVDAITGEGLAIAFQQALALADALAQGDLAPYRAAHRRISRLPGFMGKLMLQMDQHAWLRRRVLRTFTANPGLFARLLALHVGPLSPVPLGVAETMSLGWELLTA